MRKLIIFLIVVLMAFSADSAMLSRSPVSGNKSSPPEISLISNFDQVSPAVVPEFAEFSITAPPLTWGYNNNVMNQRNAANLAIVQTSEFFLGAGDRSASDGISVGLNNMTAAYTSENVVLYRFLGPGDRFLSGI